MTRLPAAASTTTVEVASSTTPEENENDADEAPIVPPSPPSSKLRRSSRGTRMRMRANVQGLDDDDSEGDIEIVDFADGNNKPIAQEKYLSASS